VEWPASDNRVSVYESARAASDITICVNPNILLLILRFGASLPLPIEDKFVAFGR